MVWQNQPVARLKVSGTVPEEPDKAKGKPTVKARSDGAQAIMEAGTVVWRADLPQPLGGTNQAPSPTALLLRALAGCAVVFIRDTLAPQLGVRVVAVGLAVLACASAAPARAADVVRVGDVTSLTTAPLYVAIDKGYMKEQGIDVVVERFAGAGKMNVAFAAGQLDVGTGTANAGLFNSLAQGFDVRIVADKGQLRAPASPNKLLARKDLAESGRIKSPKDFKGRKIASLVKGNVQDYQIAKLLEHDGITFKDVEIVYIGSPQTLQAFASNAIDGAHMIEPWATKAVADGLAVVVADSTSAPEVRQFQNAVILYAGRFIRDRRAIAQRFMNAYVKGIEYVTKQGWKDNGVVDAIFKHTGVEKDLVKRATPPYIAPDGRPDVESLARFQDWLVEQGMVTKKVPMDQVLDLSFLPPAK